MKFGPSISRVWKPLILCGLLLVAGLSVGASPAHASTTVLSCTGRGTSVSTYSPGLTNQLQSTTISTTEDYDDCVAPGSSLTAGDASFIVTLEDSCLLAVTTPQPTITYTWNNGSTSTVRFTVTIVAQLADGSAQITSTGPVLSGFGAGSLATRVKILPQLDLLLCGTPQGVTEQRGPVILEFV